MKRFYLLALVVFMTLTATAKDVKYVFLMIGDGMGVNQVFSAERYLGALKEGIGREALTMTQFPNVGLSHTYSTSNGITDSAAGGTALSSCEKTSNHTIAMNSDHTAPLTTIAEMAKSRGKAVGVITSVSIDHATPAVFYAHVPDRNDYYEIGCQLPKSNFDFFGGAWFLKPKGRDKQQEDLADIVTKGGYSILKGYDSYVSEGRKHDKVILTQTDEAAKVNYKSLPYAIDRTEKDLKLEQITTAAIDFLEAKGGKNGFFLMVEGGQIDWACHSNDGATMVTEVLDFDKSIALAYEFYKKHPNETLIVVTADHETGGVSLANSGYDLYINNLSTQHCSQAGLSAKILAKLNEKKDAFTVEDMKTILKAETGLYGDVKVSEKENEKLMEAYVKTMTEHDGVKSEYFTDEIIAATAAKIINHRSSIGWTTYGHSSGAVPIFAIGPGSEAFNRVMQNCEISSEIKRIAKY